MAAAVVPVQCSASIDSQTIGIPVSLSLPTSHSSWGKRREKAMSKLFSLMGPSWVNAGALATDSSGFTGV